VTSTAKSAIVTAAHPLDPLSPDEISAASAILRAEQGLADTARFVYIEAQEPEKAVVTGFRAGQEWDRCAALMLRERAERRTYEAVVSLTRGEVVSWREVPGGQPPMTLEEFDACEQAVKADPAWQEAMRKRGVTDFGLAMVDPWPAGYRGPDDDPSGRRLARPLTFVRSEPGENGYARPVENLIVTVDLDLMEVLDVEDHGVVPLPPQPGNYDPTLILAEDNVPAFPSAREAPRPISITQPEGVGFTVDGHSVSWGNWRLRVGFTPREGLVLHDIGYVDRGTLRPVIHRASLSEMYVPYGDPGATHWNKNVFDMGEYGLGLLANSLQLGCDCLGEIHYFDACVNDQDGAPVLLPNAICMHEEDFGIGWKHTDFRTGRGEVRRNRRLVISFFATVGNYDYGFYWNLHLDGSIEFEIKLTGIISTGALTAGEVPECGNLVAPGLFGPNHQHFFNVRLDMRVDGDRNNLYEVESAALPAGVGNPHGNAWRQVKRQLTSEAEAQRVINPLVGRAWLVTSSDKRNALGQEVGYKLEPGANVLPFFQEGSQQASRGRFATKHLWATPFATGERFAAGDYVAQNPGGDGLPAYTKGNRPLEDADLVVWYNLGAHHVVRPEDWPVMPVTRVSMHLKPAGFFDGNPMLDLPPESAAGHGACCAD
jgi:primary-amine oxidase